MVMDGLDLSAPFVAALRSAATQIVRSDVRMLARIERLVSELRPSAIVLAQEGIRTPWLMGGRGVRIPVVAVQHGVLYKGHAGYPSRRHPALCLADRTCVYGTFERDVLLDLAYEPEDVAVTGSPRLDLDTAPPEPGSAAAERAAVRGELGVAAGDRLLLVSTVNLRFVQRSHFAHMLEVLLGSPLPGIHVVFKQHPGERDEGPYRDLMLGLARAGGYVAPPLCRQGHRPVSASARRRRPSRPALDRADGGCCDAYAEPDRANRWPRRPARLCRGRRGATCQHSDDVLAALDAPREPDPVARQAFLDRHFRPGDASTRIIDEVEAAIRADRPRGRGMSRSSRPSERSARSFAGSSPSTSPPSGRGRARPRRQDGQRAAARSAADVHRPSRRGPSTRPDAA